MIRQVYNWLELLIGKGIQMFADIQLPQLPESGNPDFFQQLVEFGRFLEQHVRPGRAYDLRLWPNALWKTIEERMLYNWHIFVKTPVSYGQVLLLQWYNSGVFLKTADSMLGFDIVPVPRYYGWPEPADLSMEMAAQLDALLITHDHQDHCDHQLIEACCSLNKPVLAHTDADITGRSLMAMRDHAVFFGKKIEIKAHHACHVWRKTAAEVPLTCFEAELAGGFRLLFCGDADYTQGFAGVKPAPDMLFITWRNPGPEYEDGHPDQKATTIDAVNKVLHELTPRQLILEHYGELDHIYRGFTASYEMAIKLIEQIETPTSIYFWGDIIKPAR